MQEFQDVVRYHINQYIFDHGYAPEVDDLSGLTGRSNEEVEKALDQLATNHALVLHPNSYKIWVAHPFSLMPTLFWVECGHRSWYSNCTWCSLGVASLLQNEDVIIHTKLNGTKENLKIHIKNGRVVEDHLLVHFLVPAARLWDNVIYSCSNMLTFETEEVINHWCSKQNVKKGEVQPITRIWNMAREWYGYYLSPDWTRKTPEQAREIFKQAGLTGDFWKI